MRSLLVHGARAVIRQSGRKPDGLSGWINRLKEKRGQHKAVVALANTRVDRLGGTVE